VTINRSSGSPELDNAVRRIVMLLAPYAAFPNDLALDYDVLEIRRVWSFDTAVRLFSGGR
jgi:outer membrane biosynthesis protein TonB